jgi:hypothetical protein
MSPKQSSQPQASDLYPSSPGWREATTSREAAERIAGQALPLRKIVLDLIAKTPNGLAVHEVADLLKRPVSTVQPRCSELRRLGEIQPSGQRRINASGARAHVWIVAAAEVKHADQ